MRGFLCALAALGLLTSPSLAAVPDAAFIAALDQQYFEANGICRGTLEAQAATSEAFCEVRDAVLVPALQNAGACFDRDERIWVACASSAASD